MHKTLILGAGATGLSVAYASGLPIYEAESYPGGICSSYYLRKESSAVLQKRSTDAEDYRFEIGGGHWIFGNEQEALDLIDSLVSCNTYYRNSSVYLPSLNLIVPYPLQDNLHILPDSLQQRVIAEMQYSNKESFPLEETLDGWLQNTFGRTLCELFFDKFHELYTAGLWRSIAPQDTFKSPIMNRSNLNVNEKKHEIGYNASFKYPESDLGMLMKKLARSCNIFYNKRMVSIQPANKLIMFEDGECETYEQLVSTLPLNRMIELAGLKLRSNPDPYTSVLVINIGALKGQNAHSGHWIYLPASRMGFHRIGYYSNVDFTFLPRSHWNGNTRISMYIEKAYQGGLKPTDEEIQHIVKSTIVELQQMGIITDVEVVDPTWIDAAYTWSWPNSSWREEALEALSAHNIVQAGRYGRWNFQGIAKSIQEGLELGRRLA